MLKILTSALILFLPAISFAQPFKIATFNTESLTRPNIHKKFNLPLNLEPFQATYWNDRRFRNARFRQAAQSVAKHISIINADIIGLTEIGNWNDVNELAKYIADYGVQYSYIAICNCYSPNARHHVAILSKFPLLEIEKEIYTYGNYQKKKSNPLSESITKINKGLRVLANINGEKIHIYAMQLKSNHGDPSSKNQRVLQATIVRQAYLSKLKNKEHVIVFGDLNSNKGEPAVKQIRGYRDKHENLIQPSRPDDCTFLYNNRCNQFDHILVSKSIANKWKLTTETIPTPNDFISHHNALSVSFRTK